ncbi:hypothetical protein AKJ54_01120 [candidate division MSBL1 archaeon SCGC-AAA382K21]|uniref:Uncharacterized protein n=1 Tax=candidate division MSBL1 archaeon SCGC-AAA382K21 TaxID=1698283 RepID=A0A133VJY9_9EURY|nr:hypothetical protein AKJ54_01120 [candidate division MSBL1 archaeon SCGC-AAA382K21]
MLRREVWKVNLVLVVSFALIFSLSSQVRASPQNDAGLSRISHSDFQLGEFDNLSITGSGNICLFPSEYWGNELVIESFQTGSTKLSSSEDLLSLRFTSRRPGVLVGVETRFLKSGKDMTWNFRIEEDNCGRPSGYLDDMKEFSTPAMVRLPKHIGWEALKSTTLPRSPSEPAIPP